jgi:hypothetical protein
VIVTFDVEEVLSKSLREYMDPKVRAYRCGFEDGMGHKWAVRHIPDEDYEAGFARGYELIEMMDKASVAGEVA